jgi:Mitochondrial ribosomal subunit protein
MPVRRLPFRRIPCRTASAKPNLLVRGYAAASPQNSTGSKGTYVSPFQEIFDTIKEGKTSMGGSKFESPEIKYLKCGVPEHILRYKTTTYGRLLEEPFVRPNEHKVTLQVETQHIPLTDMERIVMKEIVGNRLNDETGVMQLSSVQFGSRIENKRHVVSMLERIVESAKALAAKVEAETKGAVEGS